MRQTLFLFILVVALSCTNNRNADYDLLIKNVNIIDGTGGTIKEGVNIYIKDQRIFAITKELLGESGSGEVIDGTGKYLIPGIIDAHVHLATPGKIEYGEQQFPNTLKQLIHFGVTSILIPGGSSGTFENFEKLSQNEKNGTWTSPQIYYTGLMCTTRDGHPMKMYTSKHYEDNVNVHIVRDTNHIKEIVKQTARYNAIGLKIIVEDGPFPPFVERLPENFISYFVSEAAKSNLKVFAHVSDMVEVKLCADNGVNALMHYAGMPINWATDSVVIDQLVKKQISWVTTMMIGKSFFYPLHKEWLQREEIIKVYDTAEVNSLKDEDGNAAAGSRQMMMAMFGNDTISLESVVPPLVQDLKAVYRKGVNVVLGTDVGGANYIFPGYSAHEEMQLLQMGGFEPIEIIKISTHNGAKMLGILNDYGTIEKGKYADLILLRDNPLQDISNTLSIEKIFKRGQIQPRINDRPTAGK